MPGYDSTDTVRQITEYIRSGVPRWVNGTLNGSNGLVIEARPWSFILRYPVLYDDHREGAILVKIAREDGMDLDQVSNGDKLLQRTQKEYEMLSEIENIFRASAGWDSFSFIHAITVLPEWNALVMDELEAVPLKRHLLRFRMILGFEKDLSRIEKLLATSARWLSVYHRGMGAIDQVPLEQSGLKDRVEDIFRRLSLMIRADTPGVALYAEINRLLGVGAKWKTPMGLIHSDFHCGNILITPDDYVAVLDADRIRGPVYEDIAKLIADLETRSVQVITFGLFFRSRQLRRFRDAIVKNYFQNSAENEAVLSLFVLVAVLHKWVMSEEKYFIETGFRRLANVLFASVRRRYYRKLVRKHIVRVQEEFSAAGVA